MIHFLTAKLEIILQHFQRDIVRGVEGYIVTGSKQVEIGMPLKVVVFLHIEFNILKALFHRQ